MKNTFKVTRGFCLIILLSLLASCSKPGNSSNNNVVSGTNTTTIPAPVSISTIISAYIQSTNGSSNPSFLLINNNVTTKIDGSYTSNIAAPADKYRSTLRETNSNTSTTRNFTVTASSRNYADVFDVKKVPIGTVIYSYNPGVWILPDGGKISYSANTFLSGGNGVSAAYASLNPTEKTYSIATPDVIADFDNQRRFLKTFGTFFLSTPYPIDAGGDLKIDYPIPASLLVTAPDSVEAWFFSGNQWIKNGYAKKVNNFYQKKIDKTGFWNFASPVHGEYKTIKFRTSNGVSITNAILRIKSDSREIAAVRTDANGNAYCFLPTNESLTVIIPFSWQDNTFPPPAFTLSIPAFTSISDITLTVPSTSSNVMTIKGTVNLCNDGSPLQNGTFTVANQGGTIYCYIPVINGQYASALITEANTIFRVKAINNTTNQVSRDSAIVLYPGQDNIVNMNTCLNATNLFLNYSIDGTNYSITGDASDPQNPPLTAYYSISGNTTRIACNSSPSGLGIGLEFVTYSSKAGTFTNTSVTGLFVNSVYRNFDINHPATLIFRRYDLLAGGYIEGSIDLYYLDNLNTSHHLKADFRVKRIL